MVGQGHDHVNTNESDQRQLHNATSIFKKKFAWKRANDQNYTLRQEINTSHLNSLKMVVKEKEAKN